MKINFKWVGGATWILTIGDLKIACDPVLCPKKTIQNYIIFRSQRLEDPQYTASDFKDVDLWLLTHKHQDHMDECGKKQILPSSTIISRGNPLSSIKKFKQSSIFPLSWGKTKTVTLKEFTIKTTAIPAIHGSNPIAATLAGRSNGYIVEIKKGNFQFTIFVTGDGVFHRKTVKAIQKCQIDLLVANLGEARMGQGLLGKMMGTLTSNSKMFTKLIQFIDPKIAIPVHFGTFSHYREPLSEIKKNKNKKITIISPGETIIIPDNGQTQ